MCINIIPEQNTMYSFKETHIKCGIPAFLDGGLSLVVYMSLQESLQLSQAVLDTRHELVHPTQV